MTDVSLDRIAQAFGMDAPKESDSHQYATVNSINADGSYQVQMNGATSTVRAAKLCDASVGDRVMCVIYGGQVAAIGRIGGDWEYAKSLADAKYLALSGGTMTGFITRKGNTLDLTAADNGLTSGWNPSFLAAKDKNDNNMALLQCYAATTGYTYTQLDARNYGTGSAVNNYLRLRVDNDGTRKVVVPDGKPWRDGIGIGYGTGTITKNYTSNGFAVEQTTLCYAGNLVTVPIQFTTTSNITYSGASTLASIPSAYAPPVQIRVPLFTANLAWDTFGTGYAMVNTDGTIKAYAKPACAVLFGCATYAIDY